jgi:hypothetical protein
MRGILALHRDGQKAAARKLHLFAYGARRASENRIQASEIDGMRDRVGLLRKAGDVAGGIDALACELKVAAGDLRGWLNADATPPSEVLLRALRVVVEQRVRQGTR